MAEITAQRRKHSHFSKMEIVLDKVTPENIVRKIVKDSTNACKAEKSIKVISVNILIIYVNFYFIV